MAHYASSPWRGRLLGVVGAGQMAEALVRPAVAAGAPDAGAVTAVDPAAARRDAFAAFGCRVSDDFAALWKGGAPDAVLLAVKPQQAEAVLSALAPLWTPPTLAISVMAGVTTARIERLLAGGGTFTPRVVRAMPNLPLVVGAGATVAARGRAATRGDEALALTLFSAGGRAWAADESLLDAVTAVSGSGPAYVFRLAETLADAGRAAGLPADLADALARETVWGAAKLLRESDDAPATLRARVTSPGGTTAAALAVLDGNDPDPFLNESPNLSALMRAAVAAAARRAKELSGE